MNYCKYCKTEIPNKTKGYKPRSYCNKSCSRKDYVENNKSRLSESAKKSFKTLKETNPDAIKHRGRLTEKKRLAFEELKKTDHYQRTGKIGAKVVIEKGNLFGGREHVKEVMVKRGRWIDCDVFNYDSFVKYTRTVRRLTSQNYGSPGKGYNWDHIVPVLVGFKLLIPPSTLCCPENVRKLTIKENTSKGAKMLKEGYDLLDIWGIDYNAEDLF